jgi:calcineurin-like phosphoesterase family protein
MRKGHRARTAWRVGRRRPADHLILARVPDRGIASLIASFPTVTRCTSGEAKEPHVTLFGPFLPETDGRKLSAAVEKALNGPDHLSCRIAGLIRLEGIKGGAIALAIDPDHGLKTLYQGLVEGLGPRVAACSWVDRPPGQRLFHISLRFNIPFREFSRVWERVTSLSPSPLFLRPKGGKPLPPIRTYLYTGDAPLDLFRVALLRRGSLLREYDLPTKTWLSRGHALSPDGWVRTREEFRWLEGLELPGPVTGVGPPFVIADLHLGHRNIIDYCRRPFSSPEEMDRILIRNWNYTVRPGDEVYFLGDLRHGRNAPDGSYYLGLLSGRVHLVRGNHDQGMTGGVDQLRIANGEFSFLLVHDPEKVPAGETAWVIHGHYHNNDIARYPFIHAGNRTINVSAELVNYSPVSLSEICEFLRRAGAGEQIPTLKEARERYPGPD